MTAKLLVLLPTISAALRFAGFQRTYSRLIRASDARVPDGADASSIRSARQTADLVVHVNRHVLPYQGKCLLESVTLCYLLRREGYAADLILGARTLLGPLEAHAWVELGGQVLNDEPHVRNIYEPLELPGTAGRPETP